MKQCYTHTRNANRVNATRFGLQKTANIEKQYSGNKYLNQCFVELDCDPFALNYERIISISARKQVTRELEKDFLTALEDGELVKTFFSKGIPH